MSDYFLKNRKLWASNRSVTERPQERKYNKCNGHIYLFIQNQASERHAKEAACLHFCFTLLLQVTLLRRPWQSQAPMSTTSKYSLALVNFDFYEKRHMLTAFPILCCITALASRPITRVKAPLFKKVIRHSSAHNDTWSNGSVEAHVSSHATFIGKSGVKNHQPNFRTKQETLVAYIIYSLNIAADKAFNENVAIE